MRRPPPALALLLGLLLAPVACGTDPLEEPQPPLQGDCAHAGGTLLGCDYGPIDTVEQACQKLLDCGVLALTSDGADRSYCLRFIGGMPDERQALALACIEVSSCDLLRGDPDICLEGTF